MQIKFAIPGRAQQYKFPQQEWPHRAAMQSTIPKTAFERRDCTKRKFPRRRKVHWTARPNSVSHTRETHKYAQPQVTGHTPPCIEGFSRLSTSCFFGLSALPPGSRKRSLGLRRHDLRRAGFSRKSLCSGWGCFYCSPSGGPYPQGSASQPTNTKLWTILKWLAPRSGK